MILPDATHPVTDGERFTVTLDPLKIADGFYVVGQHSPDGNGRLLDFFFHQVGRRGITQVGSQFFNFD
ncbi:Uncharacterised protein [Salmonella enterica subsp. enterica serovar Bovismorbificans]|uniref:Uncharacterized protein n=1 Tax=Salmonella enterica subsp. enterica serovar Bovismorbificans TaxID=58097 RepID=A0A655C7H8_SALET|nr:Uncharacterised protein [Salmonella enterica subsp. enterica serovar Bovismorbificans]CNU91756.1 Uncharacterised protein [Salmonella enterica subsp. enterica serovar Bovismorbificans]